MEALYLMDNQGLYQVDAALQMEVSRTTFARIIKSAREKVSMMLITGANLTIEDNKNGYTVMLSSMQDTILELGKPDAPFLMIYHIQENEIVDKQILKNPVITENKRPGQVLPSLCNEYQVNFFVATSIGIGFKSALLSKGIYAQNKKVFLEKDILTLAQTI
ncbi:MAG: DNA-binding protein [Sulfurovum sp.]|nr:MAG: DNA-binding protein [Sulfurovum sp.]